MISKEESEPVLGVLEWFHLGDKEHVNKTIEQLKALGIREVRTGISWADSHTPEGEAWLEWLIPTLAEHVRILPCLLYTPPSIGLSPKTSAPPRYPEYFADFTDRLLQRYGEYFDWIELWNEPNNTSEYDFQLDPNWDIFYELISGAAREVRKHDKKVLLGGMSPVAPSWLGYMYGKGLMQWIDAVGIHGFPDTFDSNWTGWPAVIQEVQDVIDRHGGQQKIWITETGYSTWQQDERKQLQQFAEVLNAPVERIYWYSLNDLDPQRPTVDGFHIDEREYYFGMVSNTGMPKLLYRILTDYGISNLDKFEWVQKPYISIPPKQKSILITGGAGFIGTNLADQLLNEGKKVTILDNLSRAGVEKNLAWLKSKHKDNLNIEVADIRNEHKVQELVHKAEFVYHFAAQVAVTTSCEHPVYDLNTNVMGTVNVLEAIRKSPHQPPLVFTSTNKVYGKLQELTLKENGTRYVPGQAGLRQGVSEDQKLDFYSPYGCSKGAADAYILDYARIYGLKTVVFRMSCIYGPHQFGTEDQGWVAHFLIQALKGNPLTIYGDGKQVRDILFVEDLVNAFKLAYNHIGHLSGEAFNIGGGSANSTSLNELLQLMEEMTGDKIACSYTDWRPGDQKYYVSDTRKFNSMTGWKPAYSLPEGIQKLHQWLTSSGVVDVSRKSVIV